MFGIYSCGSLVGVYDNSCVIIFSLDHYSRTFTIDTLFFDMPHPNKLLFLIEMHITVIPLNIDTYHIVFCLVKIRTIRLESPDTFSTNSQLIHVFSKAERVSLTIRLVTEKHNLTKNYIRCTNFMYQPILTKENIQLIRFT